MGSCSLKKCLKHFGFSIWAEEYQPNISLLLFHSIFLILFCTVSVCMLVCMYWSWLLCKFTFQHLNKLFFMIKLCFSLPTIKDSHFFPFYFQTGHRIEHWEWAQLINSFIWVLLVLKIQLHFFVQYHDMDFKEIEKFCISCFV